MTKWIKNFRKAFIYETFDIVSLTWFFNSDSNKRVTPSSATCRSPTLAVLL